MRILAKASLHKRAIRVGLLSHGIRISKFDSSVVSTGLSDLQSYLATHSASEEIKKVFVCLDAIPLVDILQWAECQDISSSVDEILFVGDTGSTAEMASKYFGIPCRNLFNQAAMADVIQNFKSMDFFSRLGNGYYPSVVYALKDLRSNSIGACFPRVGHGPRLIYAGQDGSYSIDTIFRDSDDYLRNEVKEYVAQLVRSKCASIFDVCHLFHEAYAKLRINARQIPGLYAHNWVGEHVDLILFKSIQRLLLIYFLARNGLLLFMSYPNCFVNVYMRRYFSRFVHLDLGGAGGLEAYYPRVVDGLISGQRFVAPDPILVRDSFCEYDSISSIVDNSLLDLYERILMLNHGSRMSG